MERPGVDEIFKKIKKKNTQYHETTHCKLVLEVMMDNKRGRISSFCTEAMVCETTLFNWINTHELFRKCYQIGKMYAREEWEQEGYRLRDQTNPPGVIDHSFEHWKMMGWTRFGVSKNSKIKLTLNTEDTPDKHYNQLLRQAGDGDFTASEFKQLMEAINVGIRAHEVVQLQQQIDELKSDLIIMSKNSNGQNSNTVTGTEKKD